MGSCNTGQSGRQPDRELDVHHIRPGRPHPEEVTEPIEETVRVVGCQGGGGIEAHRPSPLESMPPDEGARRIGRPVDPVGAGAQNG